MDEFAYLKDYEWLNTARKTVKADSGLKLQIDLRGDTPRKAIRLGELSHGYKPWAKLERAAPICTWTQAGEAAKLNMTIAEYMKERTQHEA
jgi:hypothetical protein